eukprot:1637505-Rhodomonas_salina.1
MALSPAFLRGGRVRLCSPDPPGGERRACSGGPRHRSIAPREMGRSEFEVRDGSQGWDPFA